MSEEDENDVTETEVKETFNFDDKSYAYYAYLDALMEDAPFVKYRTFYDQYWTKFYNQKSQNYDTDLLSLQFV
jgi:hypothetical protein